MAIMSMKTLMLSICGTNCYILYNKLTKEGFIIDPADNPKAIDAAVKELGITIKAILLTHGHFDHIGAATELKELYGVNVYSHEAEVGLAKDGMLNASAIFGFADSVSVDIALKDGQTFDLCGFKIKVIHTPGHTEGSCCYLVSDEEKDRLFSGDTLFYQSHGRTDLPTGSERKIFDSIIDKLLVLDGAIEVFAGHGMMTTIDDEKKWYRG